MSLDDMVYSKYMRAYAHMLEALAQADQFSRVPIALGALNTYKYVWNTLQIHTNTLQIQYKYIIIHMKYRHAVHVWNTYRILIEYI